MKITIAAQAWAAIVSETQAASDGLETGGILVGHDDGDSIHITIAGDPGPNALRTANRFLRDLDHAQRLAEAAWQTDKSQWVGEWHTHPTDEPVPSAIDTDSYARHLDDADLGFDRFVSIIVGVIDQQVAVAAWLIADGAITLTPFTIDSEPS